MLVTFAWSLFRAADMGDALLLWHQLFCGGFGSLYLPITEKFQDLTEISLLYRAGFGGIMNRFPWLLPCAFTCACLAGCFFMKNTQEKTEGFTPTNRKLFTVAALMFWSIMSLSEISEFLYFNF